MERFLLRDAHAKEKKSKAPEETNCKGSDIDYNRNHHKKDYHHHNHHRHHHCHHREGEDYKYAKEAGVGQGNNQAELDQVER